MGVWVCRCVGGVGREGGREGRVGEGLWGGGLSGAGWGHGRGES